MQAWQTSHCCMDFDLHGKKLMACQAQSRERIGPHCTRRGCCSQLFCHACHLFLNSIVNGTQQSPVPAFFPGCLSKWVKNNLPGEWCACLWAFINAVGSCAIDIIVALGWLALLLGWFAIANIWIALVIFWIFLVGQSCDFEPLGALNLLHLQWCGFSFWLLWNRSSFFPFFSFKIGDAVFSFLGFKVGDAVFSFLGFKVGVAVFPFFCFKIWDAAFSFLGFKVGALVFPFFSFKVGALVFPFFSFKVGALVFPFFSLVVRDSVVDRVTFILVNCALLPPAPPLKSHRSGKIDGALFHYPASLFWGTRHNG